VSTIAATVFATSGAYRDGHSPEGGLHVRPEAWGAWGVPGAPQT
jgi:hypothetical protein